MENMVDSIKVSGFMRLDGWAARQQELNFMLTMRRNRNRNRNLIYRFSIRWEEEKRRARDKAENAGRPH